MLKVSGMRHLLMGGMHGGMGGMMLAGLARRLATKVIIGVLLLAVVVLWLRQHRRW